jgi:DNA mismatch repair ATPase MutS
MLTCQYEGNLDIRNYHMGYRVDPETQDVTFLYEFKKGICEESFGIQVAKLAGLKDEVIKIAKSKSSQFHEKLKILEANIDKMA